MTRLKAVSGLLLGALLMFTSNALAQSKAIAVVLTSKGATEIQKTGGSWNALKFGAVVDNGDKIRTGADGFVALAFTDDKSQLKLRPNTEITVNGERRADYSIAKRVNMDIGELLADVKKQKGSLEVATPTSVASVKGTQFWIIVGPDGQTTVLTLEGLINLLNLITGNSVNVGEGEQGNSGSDGGLDVGDLGDGNLPEFIQEQSGLQYIEIRFNDPNDPTVEKRMVLYFREP